MKINKFVWVIVSLLISTIGCTPHSNQSTNHTVQTILSRASIRDYTNQEITSEAIDTLLKAGMSAPSSRDRRPWHFIVISDKEILTDLGSQLKNATILKNANKAIAVCGDTILSDNAWFLDCSAATQNILLTAHSQGIGAVWTAVYPYPDREAIVNRILKLPPHIRALAIIPLGYPEQETKAKNKFDTTRIHNNVFTTK